MPTNGTQDLDRAILEALRSSEQPMGSGSLYYLLKERGYNVSAPTIGRRLRDLERKSFVGKVTVEGRMITPSGIRMLQKATVDHRIRTSAENVLELLKSNRHKDIIDLLTARRIIEGESARLAALNASGNDVAKLEAIIRRQRHSMDGGGLAVKEDVSFHETLAKISGNRFIAYSVRLLRSHEWVNSAVIAIRAKFGTPVVEHEGIIAAIKEGNSLGAQELMHQHISKMISEVERYWQEEFHTTPSNGKARSRS
ncbi:MAG TPA: FCD domain-containing protein [Candidatus Acidoferrales bacterium]|jgi:GntR family L-lactate dehydrogenase operon transcriptional regulator|nr:FCD domain-containing protein [Candidatus Acidoferrales bacterium]